MLCHFSQLMFSPQKLTRSLWLAASAAVLGLAGPMLSCSFADELQFSESSPDVGSAHSVSVASGAAEGRKVAIGNDVLDKHASLCRKQ